MADIELAPVVSRRIAPLLPKTFSIAGNATYEIKAGFNLNVPNIWSVQAIILHCVTDATVANREAYINQYSDNLIMTKLKTSSITATTDAWISANLESGFANFVPLGSRYAALKDDSFLFGGNDTVLFGVTNGVAGDVLTVNILFRWRNWDLGMVSPRIQRVKE